MRPSHRLGLLIPLVGLLAISAACQRKAPGPASCRALALGMLGVDESVMASLPGLDNAVNALTVECLTTPYDRAFVDCVRRIAVPVYANELPGYFRCVTLRDQTLASQCIRQNGPGRVCYAEFRLRRASKPDAIADDTSSGWR